MTALCAFAAGLVFGIGLIIAGMFNPAKVLAFLDVAGRWDPSLGVVMVAAIPIAAAGCALARRRATSWLGTPISLPGARGVDAPLVLGSVTFGVGWGLAGLCPAPALLALAAGRPKGAVFVAAMLAGMALFELVARLRTARTRPPASSPATAMPAVSGDA